MKKQLIIFVIAIAAFLVVSHGAYDAALTGYIEAWGHNGYGQCNVPAGNDFAAIAGGGYHSLALRSDGSLAAWGYNGFGQCNVPAGNDFAAIAGGGYHSLALVSQPFPAEAIIDLIVTVKSFNLQRGIENSLDAKLQNVFDALDAANAGQRQDAINKIQAFINSVEAQRGNALTDEQADTLIDIANAIILLL